MSPQNEGEFSFEIPVEGWLYLAAIMDLYSRKAVAWAMGDTTTADLILTALAWPFIASGHPGDGNHLDRGVQYACHAYQEALWKSGMTKTTFPARRDGL